MTIHELARRRVRENSMTEREAALMLEGFARGAGKDIPWQDRAPYLSKQLADRLDRAALGWCVRHRCTDQEGKGILPRMPRDGKMLATQSKDTSK